MPLISVDLGNGQVAGGCDGQIFKPGGYCSSPRVRLPREMKTSPKMHNVIKANLFLNDKECGRLLLRIRSNSLFQFFVPEYAIIYRVCQHNIEPAGDFGLIH